MPDYIILDPETARKFRFWLTERRKTLLKGRPILIDLGPWRSWLEGRSDHGIDESEARILAAAFGPSVYEAIGRPDWAATARLQHRPRHPSGHLAGLGGLRRRTR